MTKNRFFQWVLSTLLVQVLMRLFTGGWCFIRRPDLRFRGVSNALWYEGNPDTRAGKHRRTSWKTWVCMQIPEIYQGEVHVAFDVYTGQRLALLGKTFRGGELIAFRVGHEESKVRFLSDYAATVPLPPEFVGRWEIPNDKERPLLYWVNGTKRKITYI